MLHRSSAGFLACCVAAAITLSAGIAQHLQAGAQSRGAARQAISEAGAAAISQQLATSVKRGDTRGVVALVVDRDGVLFEGAAGKLDANVAMPVNAIFNIASMTKPVTSVAIMMLLEAGKLR